MRNILLGLTLTLFFIGCGSNTTQTVEPTAEPSNIDRPSTPNVEVQKAPPSIPNI